MRTWARSRGGKILLLGTLALLLQQISAPYTASLSGVSANASLLHLHYGLLFAIAMLERDRWVLAGTFGLVLIGWLARAVSLDYDMRLWLPLGPLMYLLSWTWLVLCAQWMGWPKSPGRDRVSKRDLAKFAGIGLLLFPVGTAAIALATGWLLADPDMALGAIQILFARYFGVAVLTFPLVMAWCEDRASPSRTLQRKSWLWPALLGLVLLSGLIVSDRIHADFAPVGNGHAIVLMDYRFALFALLAWYALRLRLRVSMLLLALAMFALVQMLTGTAERNGTALGFLNLAYLAFELAVLLMAMLYFVIYERDARESAAHLEEETRLDTATGLPNLAGLRHEIQRAGVLPPQAEVGFLLLDHADHLVTGFGLDIQAQVMTTVATHLAGTARPFVLGMGQFALLPLDGAISQGDWGQVIDTIDAIEFDSGGYRFGLSPYLGVARRADATPASVEAALLRASQQAFEARRRNEVRPLYDDDGPASPSGVMRHQLHAATDALAGLRNGRLELHFQPIRPLDPAHPDSQKPDHAVGEVLCRLRDAQGRLQYPDAFLGPIESVGRSIELDLAVVRTLFELLRQYPHALPQISRIAINLTGHSLASTSFKRQLDILLADSPLPLSALCFEITENAVISSTAHTQNFLDDLRQRGCSIAIDDFGKGMQSFARLKELPIDILKIDGSFVRHVTQHGRDHALVEASVSIARAFDFITVAEFVETEATADCLRELGVQWMQGYLYAKPQPLAHMLAAASREAAGLLPDTRHSPVTGGRGFLVSGQ